MDKKITKLTIDEGLVRMLLHAYTLKVKGSGVIIELQDGSLIEYALTDDAVKFLTEYFKRG